MKLGPGSLTYDEIVQACKNIGVDLSCGACAEVFYTGVTTASHDCTGARTCVWKQYDLDSTFYETSCGHAFEFNEGSPQDNGFKFCGYCGAELIEIGKPREQDPVFEDTEIGGWCFWDETQSSFLGPYPTEEIARQKLKEYGEYLSTGVVPKS